MGSQPGLTQRLTQRGVATALTEQAAAAFVRKHGCGALAILDERAETAEELGHRVAAKTWREMADAAERLLRIEKPDAVPPRSAPPVRMEHYSSPRAAASHRR